MLNGCRVSVGNCSPTYVSLQVAVCVTKTRFNLTFNSHSESWVRRLSFRTRFIHLSPSACTQERVGGYTFASIQRRNVKKLECAWSLGRFFCCIIHNVFFTTGSLMGNICVHLVSRRTQRKHESKHQYNSSTKGADIQAADDACYLLS